MKPPDFYVRTYEKMTNIMTKKELFTALLFFISAISFSQNGKIEGYISDAENKSPLNGATVIITGNKGENTDAFGKFSINGIN
ncbi:MAG TPA: hypothetical protein VF144_01180, partial [Chitinophagaceae bacterium]